MAVNRPVSTPQPSAAIPDATVRSPNCLPPPSRRCPSRPADGPQPFLGYYFRILTAQGPAAAGGARDYVVNGELTGGFALVAWPAQYDVTGIMTFIVNQDGKVWERDLGADTAAAGASHLYLRSRYQLDRYAISRNGKDPILIRA